MEVRHNIVIRVVNQEGHTVIMKCLFWMSSAKEELENQNFVLPENHYTTYYINYIYTLFVRKINKKQSHRKVRITTMHLTFSEYKLCRRRPANFWDLNEWRRRGLLLQHSTDSVQTGHGLGTYAPSSSKGPLVGGQWSLEWLYSNS